MNLDMSKSITATEARIRLSAFIARAEKGEEFVITRSGKPIARIMSLVDAPKRLPGTATQRKDSRFENLPALTTEEYSRHGKNGCRSRYKLKAPAATRNPRKS
jgi:prevent-host-death family protein